MLRLKLLPELSKGIQMIGLLSENITQTEKSSLLKKDILTNMNEEDVFFILVNISSGDLIGVSHNCYDRYGLKSNLFNEKTVKRPNLSTIAPDLLKKSNLKNMRLSGIETFIDTTELPEKYYFLRNYAGSDEDYHLDKHKKKVRIEKSARPIFNGINAADKDLDSYISNESGSFYSYDEEQEEFEKRFKKTKIHAYISHEEERDGEKVALVEFYELEDDSSQKDTDEMSLRGGIEIEEVHIDDVSFFKIVDFNLTLTGSEPQHS